MDEYAAAALMKKQKTKTKKRQPGRFLLYITTHLSAHQMSFLSHCWPLAVQNSPQLLQKADVMVFASANNNNQNMTSDEMNAFHAAFPNNNKLIIHDYGASPTVDKSYQGGAKLPMIEAMKHRWFFEPIAYDWVIRVNLDVVIRNDSWILETFQDDDNAADGIFADCFGRKCPPPYGCMKNLIHSDFFAFRPRAIQHSAYSNDEGWSDSRSAEIVTSNMFRQYIVQYGRDRWLPDTWPHQQGKCRLSGASPQNPVTHYHDEPIIGESTRNDAQRCVDYFLQYGKVTGNRSRNSSTSDDFDDDLISRHRHSYHDTIVVLDETF
jgi:hypothetical protein